MEKNSIIISHLFLVSAKEKSEKKNQVPVMSSLRMLVKDKKKKDKDL
jgi:hypothetical protein